MHIPALFVQVILFFFYIGLFLSAYAGIQFRIGLYFVIQLPKLLKKGTWMGHRIKLPSRSFHIVLLIFFFFLLFKIKKQVIVVSISVYWTFKTAESCSRFLNPFPHMHPYLGIIGQFAWPCLIIWTD